MSLVKTNGPLFGVRTPEGIQAEINDLKKFIAMEQQYLSSGERLGTFHHPAQRIARYKKQLRNLISRLPNI
jgi:hypothetical protein